MCIKPTISINCKKSKTSVKQSKNNQRAKNLRKMTKARKRGQKIANILLVTILLATTATIYTLKPEDVTKTHKTAQIDKIHPKPLETSNLEHKAAAATTGSTTPAPTVSAHPTSSSSTTHHHHRDDIEVTTLDSSDHFFIRLLDYKLVERNLRAATIANIINQHGNDVLAVQPLDSKTIDIKKRVRFHVMKNMLYQYAQGYIPIKVKYLDSFERFGADFQLKYFDKWIDHSEHIQKLADNATLAEPLRGVVKSGSFMKYLDTVEMADRIQQIEEEFEARDLIQAQEAEPHATTVAAKAAAKTAHKAATAASPGAVPGHSPGKFYETSSTITSTHKDKEEDPYIQTKEIITTWNFPKALSNFFSLLAIIIRVMVIGLQFFLIFIRPCIARRGSANFEPSMHFASTLIWMQLFLLLGLLAENFGYAVNHPLDEMLKISRSNLIDNVNNDFARRMGRTSNRYKGSGLWKLASAGYTPSSLFEDWLPLGLLVFSILLYICAGKDTNRPSSAPRSRSRVQKEAGIGDIVKEFRTGVVVSSMVPLMTTAMNTIYATIKDRFWHPWGIAGFVVAILVVLYYLAFAGSLAKPPGEGRRDQDRYYSHLNFDLPSVASTTYSPYIEYLIQFAITILQFVLNNWLKIALIVLLLLHLVLLAKLGGAKTNANMKFFPKVKSIQTWKTMSIFFRIILLILLLVFCFYNQKFSLPVLSGVTFAFLGFLVLSFLSFLATLYHRVTGLGSGPADQLMLSEVSGGQQGKYVEMREPLRTGPNVWPPRITNTSQVVGARMFTEPRPPADLELRSRTSKKSRTKNRFATIKSYPDRPDFDDELVSGPNSRRSKNSSQYEFGDFGYNYMKRSAGSGSSSVKLSRAF